MGVWYRKWFHNVAQVFQYDAKKMSYELMYQKDCLVTYFVILYCLFGIPSDILHQISSAQYSSMYTQILTSGDEILTLRMFA